MTISSFWEAPYPGGSSLHSHRLSTAPSHTSIIQRTILSKIFSHRCKLLCLTVLFPLHCLLPVELSTKEVQQKHRLVNSLPSPGAAYKSGKTPSIPKVLLSISEEGKPEAGDKGHTLKATWLTLGWRTPHHEVQLMHSRSGLLLGGTQRGHTPCPIPGVG